MIDQHTYLAIRPMPPFKPALRKANRDGLKSMTRRVVDPQPENQLEHLAGPWWTYYWKHSGLWNDAGKVARCKYGQVGDYCYMREPLIRGFGDVAYYADDKVMVCHVLTGEAITWRWKTDLLTSIFMPREAARSIYRYEQIRVERLQDITEDDAIAEGMECPGAKTHFRVIWENINAARGFGWRKNPWVWVLGYKPLEVRDAS